MHRRERLPIVVTRREKSAARFCSGKYRIDLILFLSRSRFDRQTSTLVRLDDLRSESIFVGANRTVPCPANDWLLFHCALGRRHLTQWLDVVRPDHEQEPTIVVDEYLHRWTDLCGFSRRVLRNTPAGTVVDQLQVGSCPL